MNIVDKILLEAGVYYHGTGNVIANSDEVYIKEYDPNSTSYSKYVQGLGRFYSASEENASSYIDFRNTDKGRVYKAIIECDKPVKFKSINDLINKINEWKEKNQITDDSIANVNKMFIEYLKGEGYDCIVFKEGPSHNPDSRKFAAEVIIPFNTSDIKHSDEREYGTRNAGPLTQWNN